MSHSGSSTPSLTPSRSPSPEPPVQPDHFYGNENASAASSPAGKPWLDPADDPLAQRGIPVFKPTMDEFRDFERYMTRIEAWGMRSGIVKVIPPKEWTDSLPSVNPQLSDVKLKNPIEQRMVGHGGLFRQQNIERRKNMSVREWAEMCSTEDLRAPGKDELDLRAGAQQPRKSRRVTKKAKSEAAEAQGLQPEVVVVKNEHEGEEGIQIPMDLDEETRMDVVEDANASSSNDDKAASPPASEVAHPAEDEHLPSATPAPEESGNTGDGVESRQVGGADGGAGARKGRRAGATREEREAQIAQRAAKDASFLDDFKPLGDWLPPKTTNDDYTPEFCRELERRYWRNCGLGKSPWYGADMAGSLFTEDTTSWNVAHLPSTLTRLLPASSKGLPGVNTPYLYFGMWRATFAWHVEDMDLFSINYIHFGAPKFWYAMPQARAHALEQTMKGYFPRDIMECPQFLRHKSFLASPTVLGKSSCKPNTLVQRQGEFVITYPRGYHAGFNLGFNCAESVNFALDSWLDLGRKAKVCQCVNFSVRIDVDQLLADRKAEREAQHVQVEEQPIIDSKPKSKSKKRKAEVPGEAEPSSKKLKIRIVKPVSNDENMNVELAAAPIGVPPAEAPSLSRPKVVLKLGPQPKLPELSVFPCCLCVSQNKEGLLRVITPPAGRTSGSGVSGYFAWMAHEECANVVPETWVDKVDVAIQPLSGAPMKEKVVYGVDAIVRDRWNLKCSACVKTRFKAHGAPIQCTKGRCPKAFHVSCARDGAKDNIVYEVLGFTEKEVISVDGQASAPVAGEYVSMQPIPQPGNAPLDLALQYAAYQGGHVLQEHAQGPSYEGLDQINPSVLMQQPPPAPPPKMIKKLEVTVFCSQHNPAVSDAKKVQRQEKIKAALLALPPMARIKLRVSAGVFEVTLVSVVEDTGCVEVLWDRGIKREFKWGSVVFGKTEEIVGQKPAEPATGPDANRPGPPMPRMQSATPSIATTSNPGTGSGTTGPFPPLQNALQTIEIRPTQPEPITADKNHGITPYHIPDRFAQSQESTSQPQPAQKPPQPKSRKASRTPAPAPAVKQAQPVAGPSTQPQQEPAQPPPQPPQQAPLPAQAQQQAPHYPPPPQPQSHQQSYPSYHWNYQYPSHPQPNAPPYPPHGHYAQQPHPYYAPPPQTYPHPSAHGQAPYPPPYPPPQGYAQPEAGASTKPLLVKQHVPQSKVPNASGGAPKIARQVSKGLQWQTPYTGPKAKSGGGVQRD